MRRFPWLSSAFASIAVLLVGVVPAVPVAATTARAASSAGRLTMYKDTGHSTITGGGSTMAIGSDGAIWFVDDTGTGTAFSIGRITTAGVITHYTDPRLVDPDAQIVAGPGGSLWFTTSAAHAAVGRITTSGSITMFPIPGNSGVNGIAAGPDGALWYRGAGVIGRVTTSGAVTTFPDSRIMGQHGIVRGGDGALWFTIDTNGQSANSSDAIGRITTAGAITTYTAPTVFRPSAIGALRSGSLWFGSSQEVGYVWRITATGAITRYTGPADLALYGVSFTAAPDGGTWYTSGGNVIDRVTRAGVFTGYTLPAGSTDTSGIVAGPDHAVWFTFDGPEGTAEIGRLSLQPTLSGPAKVPTGTSAKLHGSAPRGATVTIEEARTGKPFKAIGHVMASKTSGAFAFVVKVTGTRRFKAVVGALTSNRVVVRT